MDWLNYHHLHYFWMVAKTGSVSAASRELRLTHSTVSAQIHQLEKLLGEKLFTRRGRGLVLTDVGQVAFRYANQIFGLGREFLDVVRQQSVPHSTRLSIGVTDFVPKSIVHRLLEPALRLDGSVMLVCREDRSLEHFLHELAAHNLDLVIADAPAGVGAPVRLFNHVLGDSGTTVFAAGRTAAKLAKGFPRSLDEQPFLVPGAHAGIRRGIDHWFEQQAIRPRIVAEVDDSTLLKVLAAHGHGAIAGPTVMEADARTRYGLRVVGRVPVLRHRFYAISAERRLCHPGAVAICQAARKEYFA